MRSLPGKDAKKIAIEWILIAALVVWALPVCIRDQGIEWAVDLVRSVLPVQTVVPTLIANQPLRELLGEVSDRTCEIFLLRFNQVAAPVHGSDFISAYAAEQDLFSACERVEIPRTAVVYQRNRKRPVFRAYDQR